MLEQALVFYRKTLIFLKRKLQTQFMSVAETANILQNMGIILSTLKDFKEAKKHFRHACEVYQKVCDHYSELPVPDDES